MEQIVYVHDLYLVGHLVGNDVDTLHEKRIHLVGFNFIKVIDFYIHHIIILYPIIYMFFLFSTNLYSLRITSFNILVLV